MRRIARSMVFAAFAACLGVTASPALCAESAVFCNDLNDVQFKSFTLPSPAGWAVVGGSSVSTQSCDSVPGDSGFVYALNSADNGLSRISTADGTATYVGQTLPYDTLYWNGMAWSPADGRMYAISYGFYGGNPTTVLHTIDLATGASTLVGVISGATALFDIAAHPSDGRLYGLDFPGNLVRIDPATAEATLIGPLGFAAQYAQDMDFDDATGILYLAAYNNTAGRGELRTADLTTGGSTLLEAFPGGHQVDCMAILAPPCAPLPGGIVSWWTGDGNASDETGLHDGTLSGTVSFAAGLVDEAFFLGGGYVSVPSMTALDNDNAMTVSAWIRHEGGNARIVDKITAGTADGFLFDILEGKLRFLVEDMAANGSTTIPTGEFVHVAAVNDGSSLKVYLNGLPDGSHNMSMTFPVNSLPLRIGADRDGGNAFLGLIDELQIFNRGLSTEEIAAIYQAGGHGSCKVGADLVLSVSDAPDPAVVGANVTYTLQVTNNGLDDANGVILTDTLPAGMTFDSVTPADTCAHDAGTVTCDLGSIPRGQSVTVTIGTVAGLAGVLGNLARVTSTSLDPDMGSNRVEQTTTVIALHAVRGRVRTAAGLPLAKVKVRLFSKGVLVTSAWTTATGRYSIPGVAPGTYSLKPWKRGWVFTPVSRKVTVAGVDLAGRNFTAVAR